MEYLLEGREPKMALRYFEEISRIPRGSGNEEAISQYLLDFAKEQGLDAWRDEHFNVCITKPGSQGCENLPPLMLQGHTDMVCEKNRDVDHDFLKDPIQLVVEGNILRAKGTTLGADNGVAVAWMMSILQDRTLVHPPLECVFTASEEVGLIGAHNLDYSRLHARRLINLDCGPEGVFCCGSAGGQVTDFTLPLTMEEGNGALLRLAIRGLSGGHSGGLIHMGLGNANVLMGRLFRRLMEEMDCRVQSCQGGDKDNAIPRECDASLLVPQDKMDEAQALVKQTEEEIRSQLMPQDKDFRVEITAEPAGTYQAASLEQSRQLMRLMVMLPCGPQLRDLTMNDRVEKCMRKERWIFLDFVRLIWMSMWVADLRIRIVLSISFIIISLIMSISIWTMSDILMRVRMIWMRCVKNMRRISWMPEDWILRSRGLEMMDISLSMNRVSIFCLERMW